MADKSLEDAVREQMPGWTVTKRDPRPDSAAEADAATPKLGALKKKYTHEAAEADAAVPTSDTDSVVVEKKGKHVTVDIDKVTKKIVSAQG